MRCSDLDLQPRKAGGSAAVLEALEARVCLAAAAATVAPQGYAAIRWQGRDVLARKAQWIAKFDSVKGNAKAQLAAIQQQLSRVGPNLFARRQLGDDGLVLIKTASRAKHQNLVATLKKIRGFKYLEPNLRLRAAVLPNDISFFNQPGFHNTGQNGGLIDADIDAPEAWEITTGSSDVVVGIVDTGINYNHPDLAGNIWVNPDEIAGDGVDNDNNGYIDDIHGWDFANDDSNPMDDNGHGTHVAGTVAAVGNNGIGVAGVSWSSKLMALKILDAGGDGDVASAVAALNYATLMLGRGVKVQVTNNSY